ncbi:protein kinase [Nonomuraea sp. NN258]|uniref:serine/threonine-protein kinase n=1 Tax=Nonomuraea antri TaxID=2730852 RepID=UPI001569F37E|nr:serine/threonine-protein kinase [Nonomuraea antri]NRQ30550.1 protein kinase [Nonomuraea antri]
MSPVGRGGMGMVWHAHDVLLDRDVAVKELILPFGLDHAGKQVAHRRMLREARSAARLTHPGIVTVHDVVEEDGRPWIVMELVRAWSLEQAVRQSGPLPVVQAAEIGIRVLDALRHAHAAGILHRDIKPGNVLLTSDRVVLTDFGIAAIEGDVTITQTGLLMGSPAYVPPERLSGQPLAQAADLWSFGATLYAAVEGRPPYEGPDAIAVLGAVLTQEPIRAQRAGALGPVIEGLLRKNPAERLTSSQVGEMLEHILRSHGSARPRNPETLPSQANPTPAGLLPPLESPSGPLPSRIVETPSGPVRVPYDPLTSPSGGYSMPYDGLTSPSGSHMTDQLPPLPRADAPRQAGFDAFGSPSGAQRVDGASGPHAIDGPSGAHRIDGGPPAFGGPSGPHRILADDLDDDLDGPAAPQPILPLTTDSRASSTSTPWPLASADDLRDQSRDLSHEISHSRLATLPGVSQRDRRVGRSRRRADEPSSPWTRNGRPTPLLILSALAAAVVVIGAIVIIVTSGGTPQVAQGGPSASAGESAATAEKTAASPAPEGYEQHTPPGFSAAVPANWKLITSDEGATFTGPKDSGMKIVVQQAAPKPDGGLAELSKQESEGGVEAYIQVQLQQVKYRGWKAADWEYTYTLDNGVPMHALTRYVTVDDNTAFRITFDLPELKWDDQAETRRVFLDTFRKSN